MTDTADLVPNAVGVSSDCLFNLKPSSTRARAYRASVLPTNKQTFSPGDTVISYIPGGDEIRIWIRNNPIFVLLLKIMMLQVVLLITMPLVLLIVWMCIMHLIF